MRSEYVVLLALILLALCGCAARSSTTSATKHSETNTVAGTVQIPAVGDQPAHALPVEFAWTKEWVENELVEGESHANIDGAAIGQQVAAAATAALKQAFPAVATAFSSPAPAPAGNGTAALTAAGGLGLLALREYFAHRATKADADEGWAKADAYAKQLPPDTKV